MEIQIKKGFDAIQTETVLHLLSQTVWAFGKQFIFDEYIKAGHLKTEIIAFVFVRPSLLP